MADRVFASIALLVVFGYGFIAFTGIKAPFQYDPLGPESWPRLLAVVAGFCCLWILARPDGHPFDLGAKTGVKVLLMVIALLGYAALFVPAGFIISTALYCILATLLLGGKPLQAGTFGLATGVIAYVVGVKLLDLNLPAGLLKGIV